MKKLLFILFFLPLFINAQTVERWVKTDSITDKSGTVWFKLESTGISFSGDMAGQNLFVEELQANKIGTGTANINAGSLSASEAYLGGNITTSVTYLYGSDGYGEPLQLIPYQAPVANLIVESHVDVVTDGDTYSYTYSIPFSDDSYSLNINIYGVNGENIGFSLESKTTDGFSILPDGDGTINFTAIKIVL